ncbi:MAG: S8 family serine peptidase [Candidatus Thorarchaeota archaeon]|jgi:subtilisin family serine protease
MYRRYLILLILIAPAFIIPSSLATRMILSPFDGTTPLIESRLRMEIHNSGETGSPALLEFENELTTDEIERAESFGLTFERRGTSIINVGRIYSAIVTDGTLFSELKDIGLKRATSGTKQFVPSITSSASAINADDVWNNIEVDGGAVDGTGVTVAVIDTGTSWMHPSFWRQSPGQYHTIEDGGDYYVDLNDDTIADANEGPIKSVDGLFSATFSYSSDYMFIDVDGSPGFSYISGDRWIGGIDANDDNVITLGVEDVVLLDVSKVAILYDQPTSNVYIRGVNLTLGVSVIDPHGHGTHVASTIAGGQVGFTSYVGVAPGADLIIVKSDLQSSDIIDGIDFAVENGADIINMSFSSYLGFLDGTDIEDLAVTEAFLKYGIVSVSAAGNLGDKNKHGRFLASTGENGSATFNVNNAPDYSFLSLLWLSSDRDEQIVLTTPTGVDIDLGRFSQNAPRSWEVEEDELSGYVFADISAKGLNNLIIQISTQDHDWADGSWRVTVENPAGDPVWVDVFAWDGQWETSNMRVTSNLDSSRTISSPGTADMAISVAAYSETTLNILSSSSKGPRVDGIPKPTVAAPGSNIRAAKQTPTSPLWVRKDGTSMAAPHVAGALALIRQASGEASSWTDYSALVNGAGGQTSHYETASTSWGYGLVDVLWSVTHVLDSPASDDTQLPNWVGVPELISDSTNLALEGGLDITSVKTYIDGDSLGLAVVSRGVPDYQGTNVLTIGWDNDSNLSTGVNGADVVVNVTGGTSEVFEWGGSSYLPSPMTATWWISGTAVILRIESILLGTRGDISVSTHNSTLANADMAGPGVLDDILRPLMTDVILEFIDGSLFVHTTLNDRDTAVGSVTANWDIVNGALDVLNSSSRSGEKTFTVEVPESLIGNQYINSLLFNITSESLSLVLPPLILSTQIGPHLVFTSATLDQEVVRIGLLMYDRVSGELVLEGFALATLVYLAFHSETGTWLNLTVLSGTSVFNFDFSPSLFQLGTHEVYASAMGQEGQKTEINFATLTVVQDYTIVTLGAVLLIVGAGVYVIVQRRREE